MVENVVLGIVNPELGILEFSNGDDLREECCGDMSAEEPPNMLENTSSPACVEDVELGGV